jgi:hypothetical protein
VHPLLLHRAGIGNNATLELANIVDAALSEVNAGFNAADTTSAVHQNLQTREQQ